MASLQLKNLKKIYPHSANTRKGTEKKTNLQITDKGVVAVQEFNLDIADKEFVVLVGPSGCGKTTTLRMVAGLEEITAGELYIDGKLMNDVEPKNRDISMVFQSYALYPHLKVWENIGFPLKLRKVDKATIRKRVKEVAEILDISEYLDRKPKELSGGQKQRVAIGRAIVREPKVLLMDEPLSNLDAKLRNHMRTEIIKLRQKINTTFIYVTHDQTEAMTLGDRIVIMKDGFIQQIGTPQEVFDHPANLFVAGFIGTPQMNFFEGELLQDEDGYSITVEGQPMALPLEKQNRLAAGSVQPQKIKAGVRPDYLYPAGDGKGLAAKVEVTEMMGSEVHVHCSVDGKEAVLIVPTVNKDGRHFQPPGVGEQISIGFRAELCHLFGEDGRNLEL